MSLGLQRFQHHDMVKIGHILEMTDKINLKGCADHIQKFLFTVQTKNTEVHAESIGLQKDSTRRALQISLPHIDKYFHGIELHLVPDLTRLADENMTSHLKEVVIKHIHISSNNKK